MANQELTAEIKKAFDANGEVYGSPRIYHVMRKLGLMCSENRVARLMRGAGLRAKQSRRFRATTKRNKAHRAAPNRLKQDLSANRVDQKWLADITYIPTAEGWLYRSRRIVGWSMSDRMTTDLTLAALSMALGQRRPGADLIHHSDRAPVGAFIFSGVDTLFPAGMGTAQRLTQRSKGQWGQSVTCEKGKRRFHQTDGFLRASSTWRKLHCLNPRIERDLWYRVGMMVTPTLSWMRGRLVGVPLSPPKRRIPIYRG